MTDSDQVKNIRIADYDYHLPDDYIARYPLKHRDRCKLLLQRPDGRIAHRVFSELPGLLPFSSLMVCNNTQVINARIRFTKPSGATIEVFLLEPLEPSDYVLAFQQRHHTKWRCMIGNLKRWKSDCLVKEIYLNGIATTLSATRLEPLSGNSYMVEFKWDNPEATWASVVDAAGFIPIPPYLRRNTEESDVQDYQTVYSEIEGSVAAPTAGLHFTPQIMEEIRSHNIDIEYITLHVGAGTFQPVKSETIGEHPMHTETITITQQLIHRLIKAIENHEKITAVGTTTVRTLESLPFLGHRLSKGNQNMHIAQWEAYCPETKKIDTLISLRSILAYMEHLNQPTLTASTAIMIAPGFKWRLVDAMVTNFHQPQSTLLLLVSSFLGDDSNGNPLWENVYRAALDNKYRFLSYGDACLFYPSTK